jgi:hypothetical protein
MPLNLELRGYSESQIDLVIKNPNNFMSIAKQTPISSKNPVDFIIGF